MSAAVYLFLGCLVAVSVIRGESFQSYVYSTISERIKRPFSYRIIGPDGPAVAYNGGMAKKRTGEPWMPAGRDGRSLPALTVNLLGRDVARAGARFAGG